MKSLKELVQSKPLQTVSSGSSIRIVVNFMAEKNIGLVPVLSDEGKLIGVFSERDLVKRVIAKSLDLDSTKVDDIMSKELIISNINESYEECLKKMNDKKIRHILVVDNDKLVGILSMRDLLEVDIITHKETIEVLHNYIYAK